MGLRVGLVWAAFYSVTPQTGTIGNLVSETGEIGSFLSETVEIGNFWSESGKVLVTNWQNRKLVLLTQLLPLPFFQLALLSVGFANQTTPLGPFANLPLLHLPSSASTPASPFLPADLLSSTHKGHKASSYWKSFSDASCNVQIWEAASYGKLANASELGNLGRLVLPSK